MKKQLFQLLLLTGAVFLFSCKGTSKPQDSSQPDVKSEIQKWKTDLINSKQIGQPCAEGDLEAWTNQNAGQLNGLPADENAYESQLSDYNGDGKQDLLLYFMSQNCTGHNGGTPTYARLIYSDGNSHDTDDNVMAEIKNAILSEYENLKKSDESLKPVSNNYMDENTTISGPGNENEISGEYRLYADSDAHCCPSYTGTYVYNFNTKKMSLNNVAAVNQGD